VTMEPDSRARVPVIQARQCAMGSRPAPCLLNLCESFSPFLRLLIAFG
jgi:hypothetical protein